jgi:exosortase
VLKPFVEHARHNASKEFAPQHACFLVLGLASAIIYWNAISALVVLILSDERYTYIAAIPFISLVIICFERRRIFIMAQPCPMAGAPLTLIGSVIFVAASTQPLSFDGLSFSVLAVVLTWMGAFLCCYGARPFRDACFPLLFLLWIVPLPIFFMDKVIMVLQARSADVSYVLFRLAGVPVLKHGLGLSLPGVDIEIAPQCSGIRSAFSLFISGMVTTHLLLSSPGKKLWLMLCILPALILKNAIRIVSISLLGIYLDRRFLFGNLHRYGGIPFSLVGVAILAPVVWLLWRSERSSGCNAKSSLRSVGGE